MMGKMETAVVLRCTRDALATETLGALLGARLRAGDVVALSGEFGAGKTCFVRGLASGLGFATDEVRSPTFVLHHVYRASRLTLHHIDCYRLGDGADIEFLDLDELVAGAAVAVEWSDHVDLCAWHPVKVRIGIAKDNWRFVQLDVGVATHLLGVWDEIP